MIEHIETAYYRVPLEGVGDAGHGAIDSEELITVRVAADGLSLNDIGRLRLRVASPLPVEPYARNRVTGAFILVAEGTNDTVGAGMIAA